MPPRSPNFTRHSPMPAPLSTSETKITRGHSCLSCRRKKIKCDGQHPCQNCIKSRTGCIAPQVVPARRRKRKADYLVDRLRRAEEIIAKNGLKMEDEKDYVDKGELGPEGGSIEREEDSRTPIQYTNMRITAKTPQAPQSGKLIVVGGLTRYIESSLWENINEEVREDSIHLQYQGQTNFSDDEEPEISALADYSSLLFGRLMVSNSLTSTHPPPLHIFRLWQAFIENVNPLTKIIHVPTMQQHILQASENLDKISAPMEALIFAIYHCAVVSMDNEECQETLKESRPSALEKYSTATQQALCNAKILRTSNIMVLQALTLYLLSIREFSDVDTQWIMVGIASRIGQRMGLHRESSSSSNLSILEIETRRRLLWQIMTLEGYTSLLSGHAATWANSNVDQSYLDQSRLLNVNDSDLSPNTREAPLEHTGVTEMLFCCIRYELAKFMFAHIFDTMGETKNTPFVTSIKAIDDLEAKLENSYIRFCDPSVPLHYLSTLVVRLSCSKSRLRAYAPHRYTGTASQPQAEKDAAFAISVKMIEYDNNGHTMAAKSMLKGFMWHVKIFFQLEAIIYTLSELRVRTIGDQADWAWSQIEACYVNHTEILHETKNKLWFAVGNLALKAWEERVKARQLQQYGFQIQRPEFIRELYEQRRIKGPFPARNGTEFTVGFPPTALGTQQPLPVWDGSLGNDDTLLPSAYIPLDTTVEGVMDWDYWQNLFDDCGVPLFG